MFLLIGLTIALLGVLAVGGFSQAKGTFGRKLAPYLACVTAGVVLILAEIVLVEYWAANSP
jgi:hypothetical protein